MPIIFQNEKRYSPVISDEIKSLPTVDTASGSVATFETDMTENLIEVVCDIQYSQASGTPTPSNPLPITVYTSLNLSQMSDITNKSYFDGLLKGTYNYLIDLGALNWSVYGTNRFYVGLNPRGLNSNLTSLCSAYQREPNNLDNANMVDKSYSIKGTYMVICDSSFSSADDLKNSLLGKVLIYELQTPITPIITPTDFETLLSKFGISGKLFNIPFGQMVAKGTLNVTTGVLVIEKGATIFDGSADEWWSDYSAGNGYYINVPEMKSGNNLPSISNSFPQYSGVNAIGLRYGFNNTYAYFYQANTIDNITDLASWKTWLNNNPVTIVYDLENDLTIQLSATQITALLNENNIWCDTNGDTEVKYILSVGEYLRQS